ncbi:hypothetical protein ABW21_db0208078 [Orbilia brochopaga]|nr:hypothetical protein ABW21_db0208078 [Drechslerella brochopaga]
MRSNIGRAISALVYGGMVSGTHAQNVGTSTVIEYVTERPTVTAYRAAERQLVNPLQQPLGMCSDVSRSLFGTSSTTTTTTGATPTRTIEPGVTFAIEVVPEDSRQSIGLNPESTQYLLIARPYVVIFSGAVTPPWFLDDAQNLVFDHTGLNLAIAPMDFPPVFRSLRARQDDDDDDYDGQDDDLELIVAGNATMPPGGPIYSKWIPGPLSAGIQQLFVVDDMQRTTDLTFLACYEDTPLYNRTTWQLEAVFDYPEAAPTSCVPVRLLASVIGSIIASSTSASTLFPTATDTLETTTLIMTGTATSTITSASASSTSRPQYFPIIVGIPSALERRADDASQSNGVWYLAQEDGTPIARQNIQPPYWYQNQQRELLDAATGQMLEFSQPSASGDTTTFTRFSVLADDSIEIIYGRAQDIQYIGCPTGPIGAIYNISAAFGEDVPSILDAQPDCRVIELTAFTAAPQPTTVDVKTTIESTTTPYQTVTAFEPNVSGCNAVDYPEAYDDPTLPIGEFATVCFCWSFVAETVSDTSTVSCTPTIIEIEASITSISVSGVLSAESNDTVATNGEGISRRAQGIDISLAATTTAASGDIIIIPTPPAYESILSTSPGVVSDICTGLLEANGVDILTITMVDVVIVTAANVTSTTVSVQTVCWEMGTVVYQTGISSTPVAVICPVTVTGA